MARNKLTILQKSDLIPIAHSGGGLNHLATVISGFKGANHMFTIMVSTKEDEPIILVEPIL